MTAIKANIRSLACTWRSLLIALLLFGCAIASPDTASSDKAPIIEWELVATHVHDPDRFTQGLDLEDGIWLESSGGFNDSFVVTENAERSIAGRRLPAGEFAEGATFAGEHIWLLTWRNGIARRLDRRLGNAHRFHYEGEGWGLTWDGDALIMSDGSERLTFRDPATFDVLRSVIVRDGIRAIGRLNELEHDGTLVWANIFGSDRVAAINPHTGSVCGWLDLAPLGERFDRPMFWDSVNNVLNGIAHDARTDHLHVTGKRWPERYEIAPRIPPITHACAAERATRRK